LDAQTLKVKTRRIASLDAVRGFAVLFVIFAHASVYGPFYPGGDAPSTAVLNPSSPVEMGVTYFFFVTGISLAVSLHNRQKNRNQSLNQITKHIIKYYGMLVLIGIFINPLVGVITENPIVFSSITNRIYGSFGKDEICMIGITDLVVFLFVYYLSWKVLFTLSSASFTLTSLILSFSLYPDLPILSALLFTGDFALFKTFPLVLLGGVVGKKLLEGKKSFAKWASVIGIVTFIGFLVMLEFLGGGIDISGARKLYWFAFAMTVGFGFMILGLFTFLENRDLNLTPITVLGRLALPVYVISQIVLQVLIGFIPPCPDLGLSIIFGISEAAIIWGAVYLYAKWRWPSDYSKTEAANH
jgi:peptidoglycan/LPS O-acetylase OafA/YrhL